MFTLRHLAAFAFLIQKAARRRTGGYTAALRHLGAGGLFLLAILDSSPLPTFGGTDILTAILSARHGEPWYYYGLIATAGSVIGAYLTFRMARRAGASYMQRKFGERRVAGLLKFFQRWGTGALVITAGVPFPTPTSAFFATAGVMNYPVQRFLIVVTAARAARYFAVAAVASHYGRHFIRVLRHPTQYLGWMLLIVVIAILLTAAAIAVSRKLELADGNTVSS